MIVSAKVRSTDEPARIEGSLVGVPTDRNNTPKKLPYNGSISLTHRFSLVGVLTDRNNTLKRLPCNGSISLTHRFPLVGVLTDRNNNLKRLPCNGSVSQTHLPYFHKTQPMKTCIHPVRYKTAIVPAKDYNAYSSIFERPSPC